MKTRQFPALFLFCLTFSLWILTATDNALAYIDPNTGGIFFTSVLPFVYGILAAIVLFWKRILIFIKGLFVKEKEEKDD